MGAPRRFRLIFTLSAEKILLYLFEKAKPKAHFHTRVFFFHIIPYSTVKDTAGLSAARAVDLQPALRGVSLSGSRGGGAAAGGVRGAACAGPAGQGTTQWARDETSRGD